jgi:hypothetical protein
MLGPRASAAKIDERAAMLRGLVDRARQYMYGNQWLPITGAVRERIDHYENLAARLRELPWWMLRHSE